MSIEHQKYFDDWVKFILSLELLFLLMLPLLYRSHFSYRITYRAYNRNTDLPQRYLLWELFGRNASTCMFVCVCVDRLKGAERRKPFNGRFFFFSSNIKYFRLSLAFYISRVRHCLVDFLPFTFQYCFIMQQIKFSSTIYLFRKFHVTFIIIIYVYPCFSAFPHLQLILLPG